MAKQASITTNINQSSSTYLNINFDFDDPAEKIDKSNIIKLLNFPKNITSQGHYLSLRFIKYDRKSLFEVSRPKNVAAILLPMPSSLIDNYGVQYDATEIGNLLGSIITPAYPGQNQGTMRAAQSSIMSKPGGSLLAPAGAGAVMAANKGNQLLNGAMGGMFGNLPDALWSLSGYSPNNFATIMFRGPTYRTQRFQWVLSPREESESNTIRDILLHIKRYMMPGLAMGGAFFSHPYIVLPTIVGKAITDAATRSYFIHFRPAVIANMTTDYYGSGAPTFFAGTGAPESVSLDLQLQEIEYDIAANDIEETTTQP